MDSAERYSGRAVRLANTRLGRIYRKLYVHPLRFYGDLQREGIVNWHREVKSFASSFSGDARMLDLGSGARRIGKNVIAVDLRRHPTVDVVGDVAKVPIRDCSVDGVILQMVLEHVPDPPGALREAVRVLKPGGRVYCEVPFLFPVHERNDYQRWTLAGLRNLCGAMNIRLVKEGVCVGPFSVLSVLVRRLATLYARSIYLEAALDLILGWLLWPIKYLDGLLPSVPDAEVVAGGVYVIGVREA